LAPALPCVGFPRARPLRGTRFHFALGALGGGGVCYVGEPIALVVAESRRIAEDAAALVALELEPLPAVADPRAGLERGAPRARPDCPDNLAAHWVAQYGEIEAPFPGPAHPLPQPLRLPNTRGRASQTRAPLAPYHRLAPVL